MTRGQIAVITPEGKLLTSTEFNGGMYPIGEDGYGQQIFSELYGNIDTVEEYREYVEHFNREAGFGYEEELFQEVPDDYADMRDYYSTFFSDYLYIKNLSDSDFIFTDKNGQKVRVASDDIVIFHFGEFYAADEYDLDKRQLIDDLLSLKEAVPDMAHDKVYDELWRLCADWEQSERNSDLTDRIQEWDFVTPDFVEDLMKENATSVSRMRHFIGDTYEAEIYILDGYGNVRNCDDDDFTGLIDELAEQLTKEIRPPQPLKAKGMEMGG